MPLSVNYTPPKGLYNKTQIACLGIIHHFLEKMDRAMGRQGKKNTILLFWHLFFVPLTQKTFVSSFFNLSL
jgi:hypothetical protein